MKKILSYPAIFRKDKTDDGWWNVSFPDLWGGVTCGNSFEDAIIMAKDLLRCLFDEMPNQFDSPTSLEETQSNFPDDLILLIETEVEEKKSNLENDSYRKMNKSFFFYFKKKFHEVRGSLFDYRNSKIWILDNNGKRIKEITDIEMKHNLLLIARADSYESLTNNKLRHSIVHFSDGKRAIDKYKIESKIKIFDRYIFCFIGDVFDETFLCLQIKKNEFVNLGDFYDKDGLILKMYGEKICFQKEDFEFGADFLLKIASILNRIDFDFNTGHQEYTKQYVEQLILSKKD